MLILPASFWLQTDETKKTTAGVVDSLVREPIELFRMVKKEIGKSADKEYDKEEYFGPRLKEKDSITARIQEEAKTEEWLKRVYTSAIGEQNVGKTQRGFYETGEPRMVTSVKRPETLTGNIIRDVGAFTASFVGLGKVTKPVEAFKTYQKAKALAPKTTAITSAVTRGEAAVQLSIDPYRENLANIIGDLITDDKEGYFGYLDDIEKYLLDPIKSSQEKTQLENRIGLLAEGLVITSGVYALIKSAPPVARSVTTAIKNNKDSFINSIKDLRTKSTETKQEFLNIIRSRFKEPEPITLAKEEGVSTKDLKSQGPISRLISKTNLQFSTSSLVRSLESWRLRTFTARGNMTPDMHERFLKSENTKQQWNSTIDFIGKELDDALHTTIKQVKKSKGNKEALLKQVNRVLFTDFRVPTIQTVSKTGKGKQTTLGRSQAPTFEEELLKLPKSLHAPIKRARTLQDDITKLWLESSHLTPKTKEAWAKELGVYFKKAYRLFDDPTYQPSMRSAKVRNLIESEAIELRRLNPNLSEVKARQQAVGKVNQIIASGKSGKTFGQSLAELEKLNSKELIERSIITPELREVLAPFDDAVSIVINSTKKTSDHIENLKFYEREWALGENVYFFRKPTGIFTEQMPQGFGKLSGKAGNPRANSEIGKKGYNVYTTKQMKDYLTQSDTFMSDSIFSNMIVRPLLAMKYAAQKNATIFSLLTNAKNFIGMNQFSLLSGVNPYNPRRIKQVHNMLRTQFKKSTEEQQAWYEKVSGYGLVGKNTVVGDLKGLADDLGKSGGIISKLAENDGTRNYNLKSFDSAATKFYTSVDDFGKLNMWLAEIEHMTKVRNALPKGSKYDKYRKSDLQIEEDAARLVRNNMPNYDMLPRNLKKLRKYPVLGAFYSFSAESLRNTINALRAIPTDFKIANDLTASGATKAAAIQTERAMKRLVGFGSMAGAGEAMRLYLQETQDISDAEYKAAEEYLAPFYRDSILMRNEKGHLVAFNYGSWDAINYPKITGKLAYNLMTDPNFNDDELWADYLIPYISDMAGSFVGPSITQKVINQYISDGKDRRGSLMSHPFDKSKRFRTNEDNWVQWTDQDNLEILLWNLGTMFPPFTPDVKRGITYSQTKDFTKDDFGQDIDPETKLMVGASYTTLNPEFLEQQYKLRISNFITAKKERNNELWRATSQRTTNPIFNDTYFRANLAYRKDFAELTKQTYDAKILGLDVTSILLDQSIQGTDRDALLNIENSTIMFEPLNFSLELEDYTSTTELERKLYDKSRMPLIDTYILPSDIAKIDAQFRLYPILIGPDDLKEYPTIGEIEDEYEREQKVVGGLIEGQKVPYAKEYPEERINPYTGKPYTDLYYNTTQRKPVNKGGRIGYASGTPDDPTFIEKAGKAVKSLYDTTRTIGSMKKPKDVLRIIDSRSKYLTKQLYHMTDEQHQEIMDYNREERNQYESKQRSMETELDELENYRSKLLSKSPQNSVETIKDYISMGVQQTFLSKFSKLGAATPAGTLNSGWGGRIIEGEYTRIEGELADMEIAESYKGETPLLPSIYEPKLLEERALDLGDYGEYNKFIRNIQTGQEKGPSLQLLKAATGPKSKFPLSKSEQEDMGLYNLVSKTPSLEEIGETFSGPATTREELLRIAEARSPKLKQQEYYPASTEGRFMSSVEPIDPVDGTTDYSITETDDILEELNNAIDYADETKSYYGKDIAFLQSAETYGYSGPNGIGDLFLQSDVNDRLAIDQGLEEMTDWDRVNREVEQLSETELEKLFNDTTKNITPDKLSNLAENIARLRYYTDPYKHIRPDLATWEVDDVDMEWLDGISIYGNEDTGWTLIDKFNPYGKIGVVEGEPLYGDAEAAQFALQDYIRNVGVIGVDREGGMVMPSQGINMGTLPDPQEYAEFMVKETDEEDTYQTKGYTQNPQHCSSEYEAENAIGWAQLSTRNLADGSQSQHAEAIQSDLHQAANSASKYGRRTGYKSDRERDTKAVIEHLEKVLKDFEITSNPIEQFADTLGTHRFMFKNIKQTETMKDLVKDIIVDESLEGDRRQANIDASFGQLKRYLFEPVNEAEIVQEDQEIFGDRVDWRNIESFLSESTRYKGDDGKMIKSYKETRKGYSEENLKKLARSAIIRETAEAILSSPKTKWVSDEDDLYDKDAHIPVNNRYYYDMTEAAIPDLPMKDGEWRKSIWKRSINRGIQNGKTKFSWSPAWIQEVHWGQDEAPIHKVADQDLARLSKNLAKEYGGEFKTEQLIITEAEIKSGKGGINISKLIKEIANDPKKGDFMIDGEWLHADIIANDKLDLQLYLESPETVTEIKINVPVLDLTGKAADRWKRLGYSMAKGGLVQQMQGLGIT